MWIILSRNFYLYKQIFMEHIDSVSYYVFTFF